MAQYGIEDYPAKALSANIDAAGPTWRSELRKILQLAGPISISNFFGIFMQLTDLAFVGHLGADSLAAAALG
jgi:Na+-driven multidrug efflux pump